MSQPRYQAAPPRKLSVPDQVHRRHEIVNSLLAGAQLLPLLLELDEENFAVLDGYPITDNRRRRTGKATRGQTEGAHSATRLISRSSKTRYRTRRLELLLSQSGHCECCLKAQVLASFILHIWCRSRSNTRRPDRTVASSNTSHERTCIEEIEDSSSLPGSRGPPSE